jgi:hypothetical protein
VGGIGVGGTAVGAAVGATVGFGVGVGAVPHALSAKIKTGIATDNKTFRIFYSP